MPGLISVIVTTYNWPEALSACIISLLNQQDRHFEIVIADDGSGATTQQLIAGFQRHSPIPIQHIHHHDNGFRAGTIRNKAVAISRGDYLLFMDGDCIALPNFISRHRLLAELGYFVPGNRVLLSQTYTERVLAHQLTLHRESLAFFIGLWLQRRINRFLPLIALPFHSWRYRQPQFWQKAMTCNLAIWKSDFLAVNGFDEVFQGWGYEDSDLVIRLIHLGVKRKEGRFAVPVLHLWHRQNDRSRHDQNYRRLLDRLEQKALIRAKVGVDQYLPAHT
ncbi:glycosyltransferase family 2 protein [Methylomonas sp. SURF-2]|uniref:Glycosyltransferase family 2 protein n=1 Tax=Methylomonas subterranea TaxID=2952225 RepID=A0ABT1TI41_9GAMM|nr:glycosyltransferase family 2 protein [Methylomonas sp. SURF-2]MCQ8104979.1 glycosyltransferase family 2 protein [Methylomonas sp. SURF-2]